MCIRDSFVVSATSADGTLQYTLPTNVTRQIVTGLAKNRQYSVQRTINGNTATITIAPGADATSDDGGVLVIES